MIITPMQLIGFAIFLIALFFIRTMLLKRPVTSLLKERRIILGYALGSIVFVPYQKFASNMTWNESIINYIVTLILVVVGMLVVDYVVEYKDKSK
jgi:hypothetical protein